MAKTSKRKQISPTAQLVGIVMIAVAALLLLIAIFGNILGPVGKAIRHFFLGSFGLSFYAFNVALLCVGIAVLNGARPKIGVGKIAIIVGLYVVAVMTLHLISVHSTIIVGKYAFAAHIDAVYHYEGAATFGGVLASVIVYPLATLITPVASYILYALLIGTLAFAWFGFRTLKGKSGLRLAKPAPKSQTGSAPIAPVRPKKEEVLFVRNPDHLPPQGFGDVGTHSLFVDTVAPPKREERALPKEAPAPRYTAQGKPLSEKAHGSLYGGFAPVEPLKTEPMDIYMPDYITKKTEKSAPAPHPEIMTYPAAEPKPAQIVHAASEQPRGGIIDGESRSRELEEAKKREEKIAEAEKKLEEEQSRRAAGFAEAPKTPPPQGRLIIGDEESERILSQRAAQDAAAAKLAQQRASASFGVTPSPVTAPEQPKRLFATPIIDGEAEHAPAPPAEIRSGPNPKFSDIVARDVRPVETAESQDASFVLSKNEAPKPTDGFDFGKVFQSSAASDTPASEAPASVAPAAPSAPTPPAPERKRDDFSLFGLLGGTKESAPAPASAPNDILFDSKPSPVTPAPRLDEVKKDAGEPPRDQATDETELSPFAFLDALKPAPAVAPTPTEPIRVAEPDADTDEASEDAFESDDATETEDREYLPPTTENIRKVTADTRDLAREQLGLDDYKQQIVEELPQEEEAELFRTSGKRFSKPPIDLLYNTSTYTSEVTEEAVERGNILVDKLKEFKIPCEVCGICRGPAVSRYELQMADGVSVNKVKGHADDIAYALAVSGGVRIEAPVPGKRAVGVEVPNESIGIVSLREIMESDEFVGAKSPLAFAVGTDVAGKKIICDLAKMPHLLVAGTTGSGKSSCLNSLIISMISRTSPEDVRLILIDPKRVEFAAYDGLPHMLLSHAITEWGNALNALQWLIDEYERRFKLFQKMRVRDLGSYNMHADVKNGKREKLPYLVVIIDEMADLIFNSKQQFEDKIRAIAQKARAAGIHMVIATQRPSTDVITGTIKANLGSRIAFAVTNYTDSRVILDQGGAENLLGRGDMLYAPQNFPDPIRVQGAFVTDEERDNVINFIQEHNDAVFDERIERAIYPAPAPEDETVSAGGDASSEFDELTLPVLWYFIETGKSSISSVQRKFRVGFNRAASIVDDLEVNQFIGSDGISKERTVLITKEEFIARFGNPTWQ